jgi:antitoxin Phd
MAKVNRRKKQIYHRKHRHKTWQLQEAKARFSELVNEVIEDGYHTITKNGQPVVVVISQKEFEKFQSPEKSLSEFLLESPFSQSELDIQREKDLGREIDL